MGEIKRTHLPGVGDRRDFVTAGGDRIGFVTHRDGTIDLLIYDREDEDRCRAVIQMSAGDIATLVELVDAARE